MAIDITGYVSDAQQLEVAVAGPGEANRLIICTGRVGLPAGPFERNYRFAIGPQLSHPDFHRAIAAVSVGSILLNIVTQGGFGSSQIQVNAGITRVDADWDDESGRTMVDLDLRQSATEIASLSYTVHILAGGGNA